MKKYEEITLMEEIESKEIKKDVDKWKKYCLWAISIVLPFIIIFLVVGLFYITIFISIIFLIGIAYLYYQLTILKQLYKIAKHNDMIRHDEMIRARERARLEEINYQTTTTKNNKEINNTINQLDLNNKKPKIPNK